jgi:HSF-type DNA-binding
LQYKKLRGTNELFPATLHRLLESATSSRHSSIIRWLEHGRAFKVYDRQRLVEDVLPDYFQGQKQFASFQRQLSMYGFYQLTGDHDGKGAYYHPFLLRYRPALSKLILPLGQSRGSKRRTFDDSTEPDFKQFRPLTPALSSAHGESREAARAGLGDSMEETDRLNLTNWVAPLQLQEQPRACASLAEPGVASLSPDIGQLDTQVSLRGAGSHTAHRETLYRVDLTSPFLIHRLYHSTGELNQYAFPLQGSNLPLEMTASVHAGTSTAESNQLGKDNQASFANDRVVPGGQETQMAGQVSLGDHEPLTHYPEYREPEWCVSSAQQNLLPSSIEPMPHGGDIDTSKPMDQGARIAETISCFTAMDSASSSGTSNSSGRSTHSLALSYDCGSEMTD